MPIAKELHDGGVPIKIWTGDVEAGAITQLLNVSKLPIIYKQVVAMADTHQGYGTTVGSVVATKDAIIPYAIGSDIGCGMNALKTNVPVSWFDQDILKKFRQSLERSIPLGRFEHDHPTKETCEWDGWNRFDKLHSQVQDNKMKAMKQMGSLGSGNHFVEICQDKEGWTWIMLHSGSRNMGKRVGDIYVEMAQKLNAEQQIELPNQELAYLVKNTPEFDGYIHDMLWCQDYAFKSRDVMLNLAVKDLRFLFPNHELTIEFRVNCHHNFAVIENHFGEDVYVTRKGAVRARKDDWVIIPGSMGTRSFIAKGKGEEQSFNSSPHGAGRRMSRGEARRTFTLDDLAKQTDGVECRKDAEVLDEIPGAYKKIEDVMENSSDLVEPVYELKQILCLKGGDMGKRKRRH